METRIPPPVFLLLAAAAMAAMHHFAPGPRLLPAPWNWLGLLPCALGAVLDKRTYRRFRRFQTTINPMHPEQASRLVSGDVFELSRNPMYLGLVLLLAGLAVLLGTASPWLVLPVFVIVITWLQIIPEERALTRRFGDEYVAYCRRVNRWFGRRR
jgi:protein-S-isoprenylcysteine O-methyltransferase Ste14